MILDKRYKIIGCILLSFLFSNGIIGQSPYTQFEAVKNDTLNSQHMTGVSEIIVFHPSSGDLSLQDESGNSFSFEYIPDQGFTGRDTFTVEYYNDYGGDLKYLHAVVNVKESFVHGGDDFFIIEKNSDYQFVDVLQNDNSTAGGLEIHSFPFKKSAYVDLNNGLDSLFVKPQANHTGKSQIIYTVCDSLNACDNVEVDLLVIDTSAQAESDTLHLQTTSNKSINFYLPDSTFNLVDDPSIGTLEEFYNGYMVTYNPFQNIEGLDTIVYEENGVEKTVFIDVIEKEQVNTYVVDDYKYTYPDDTLNFDVFDNDIVMNGLLTNYSTPQDGNLIHQGDGEFTYIAAEEPGLYSFSYEACIASGGCETGKVDIYVGTLAPEGIYRYDLTTPKNRPFVINYDVPLSNFSFEVTQDPQNGTLEVHPGIDTLNIGCDQLIGQNLVTYTPDQDFVGNDLFELEYCASSSDICQTVKVDMKVSDVELDSSSCVCVDNCVWPGDMNADGMVDMLDLLTYGWHIGDNGTSRPYADGQSWHPQYSPSWNEMSVMNADMKHLDSDGNGSIEQSDLQAIDQFYMKRNDLAPEHDPSTKEFPLNLVYVGEPNPQPGDYLLFEIHAGNTSYPASFLHGISLHYDVDPAVVDTSTLEMNLSGNSFISYDAMTESLSKHMGRSIDGAITRLDQVSPSGFGKIGTLGFVIEDEVDGIRSDSRLPIKVTMNNSFTMDGFGNLYKLPSSQKIIHINTEERNSTGQIYTYPNPVLSNHRVNLRFTPVQSNSQLRIHNMNSEVVHSDEIREGKRKYSFNTNLPSGVYIVSLIDEDRTYTTQKLIVQ